MYITANCTFEIEPRDAIQTAVRLEWTLDQFYSDGGTTKFVDRLAATLGIHPGSIKVVGVYEGSLILKYDIIIDEIDGEPEEEAPIDIDEADPNGDGEINPDNNEGNVDDDDKEDGDTKPVKKPLT